MTEYIEREAALEIAMQYCPDDDGSCGKAGVDLREMLDEIEAIPAADVVPVRHGAWVQKREKVTISSFWVRWECSECGYCRTRGWERTSDGRKPRANLCEMCGALMDKDGDGDD